MWILSSAFELLLEALIDILRWTDDINELITKVILSDLLLIQQLRYIFHAM